MLKVKINTHSHLAQHKTGILFFNLFLKKKIYKTKNLLGILKVGIISFYFGTESMNYHGGYTPLRSPIILLLFFFYWTKL